MSCSSAPICARRASRRRTSSTARLSAASARRRRPLHSREDELAVYKRGRNAHVHGVPKNATREQYSRATGLEALFGALYLLGKTERIAALYALAREEEPHAV